MFTYSFTYYYMVFIYYEAWIAPFEVRVYHIMFKVLFVKSSPYVHIFIYMLLHGIYLL